VAGVGFTNVQQIENPSQLPLLRFGEYVFKRVHSNSVRAKQFYKMMTPNMYGRRGSAGYDTMYYEYQYSTVRTVSPVVGVGNGM